ncbi:MAG: apolipoprotein N-acyltransferase [Bdellovibrionota bacterium]
MGKKKWAIATLSGLLVGISVLPTDLIPLGHWTVFFGFLPLWNLWLNESRARDIFLGGWWVQFLLTLLAFNWIAHTVHEFGLIPWPLSVLILLTFCSLANLFVPLAGLVWAKVFPPRIYGEGWRILALVVLTAIGERIFPMIFEWNFGYVWFYEQWPGFQFADVIGFRGLSTASLAVNGLVLYAWRKKQQKTRWWIPLASASVFLMALNWAGAYRKHVLSAPDGTLRALVVQANIGNKQKHLADFGEKYREAIIGKYIALTEKALSESLIAPDFVIWPENAFPEVIVEPNLTYGPAVALKSLLTRRHIQLVTGGFGFNGTDSITNSVFLLSREGSWVSPPYRKTVLMPFGEYIPGAKVFPWLKKLLPHVRDFGTGSGPQVFPLGELRLGIQICYEGLFDWFARELAQKRANVIVNVTNDSWYGTWEQPFQHFYMTLGRAVETRLPLLRSTNTGISGVALASGQVLEASPLHEEWTHLYEIPYRSQPVPSPFTSYGYWIVPALLWGLLIAIILFRFSSRFTGRKG